ncbi:beta-phosphoglucomutase [Rossellomorea marisflavi]|uniref:beta-phosphoglucomutase n=1 Tax=Rossellomorea marisflavi TaxID=189381 RepID=UPI0035158F8B
MKTIEGVIFDMDGVLTDTMPLYYEATRDTLLPFGIDYTWEQNNRLKGISRRETIRTVWREAGKEIEEDLEILLAEERNRRYLQLMDSLTPDHVLPGMESFLKELKENGIRMAVASSSRNAPEVLKKTGLSWAFEYTIDPLSLTRGKPDPEIFQKARALLGVEERRCVGIEDGEAGLRGLLETGMFTVGVGSDPFMKNADWPIASTMELTLTALQGQYQKWCGK